MDFSIFLNILDANNDQHSKKDTKRSWWCYVRGMERKQRQESEKLGEGLLRYKREIFQLMTEEGGGGGGRRGSIGGGDVLV